MVYFDSWLLIDKIVKFQAKIVKFLAKILKIQAKIVKFHAKNNEISTEMVNFKQKQSNTQHCIEQNKKVNFAAYMRARL